MSCSCCIIPQRWCGVLLATLVIIVAYAMRVSTHLTIIVMVENDTAPLCIPPRSIGKTTFVKHDNYDWSEVIQGWIIASFYIGYITFYFPAYILVQGLGARWTLSTCILMCTVCSCLIPVSVDNAGYGAMIVFRLLQGVGQAALLPAIRVYLESWIVPSDRPVVASIIFSGTPIGCTLGIMISGFLMYLFDDWRVVYYFWACSGGVLYIFLVIFLYSDPSTNRCILEDELKFIQDELECSAIKKTHTPYKKIARDGAVIASIFGEIGHVTISFFFVNDFPKFMHNIIAYPLVDTAVVAAIPYLAPVLVLILTGKLADWGIISKDWDIGFTRKCFVVVATALASMFLVVMGYMICDDEPVIAMLVITMLLLGFHYPGLRANTLDLTTQYAGFVSAVPHGISAVIGVAQPIFCAYMAPNRTEDEWICIFWIFCAIASLCTIIFFVMGSGKRRRWDYPIRVRKYFEGKVPWFSICDGFDKDAQDVHLGPQRERYEDVLQFRRTYMHPKE